MARVPRIPAPVIDQLPRPRQTTIVQPPVTDTIKPPVVDVPSFVAPTYTPPTLTPETPEAADPVPRVSPTFPTEQETQEEPTRESSDLPADLNVPTTPGAPAPRPEITVPVVGVVPLPYKREVALAGTTAVAATAAALIGKSMVEQLLKLMKPIVRKIMLKIKERSGKQFTDYELQQFFEFEGRVPELRALNRAMKREQKREKQKQLAKEIQRRQNKSRHTENSGGTERLREQLHHNGVVERVQNQVEP